MLNERIEEWRNSALGRYLFEIEKNLLVRTLKGVMGNCFLQWGNQDCYDLESQIAFEQHIYLSGQNDFPLFTRGLMVDARKLPFLTESIDIILLPYVLEFIQDPFSLIREATRILKPGGCLIILNFNPVSFWGLGKFFSRNKQFPWDGKSMSALYLRCLFGRMGLKVVEYKTDFFRPLFSSAQKLEHWLAMETIGQLCWPFLGAIYMMVVCKQEEEMILIKSKPSLPVSIPKLNNQHPEPTTHTHA